MECYLHTIILTAINYLHYKDDMFILSDVSISLGDSTGLSYTTDDLRLRNLISGGKGTELNTLNAKLCVNGSIAIQAPKNSGDTVTIQSETDFYKRFC